MRIATFNFRGGGGAGRPEHWPALQRRLRADVLLTQESRHPAAAGRHRTALWDEAARGWGTGLYARTLAVKPLEVKGFRGWVTGGELAGARPGGNPLRIFSVHCPAGKGGYVATVHRILDALQALPGGADLILGGDFNVAVGVRGDGESIQLSRAERALLARVTGELQLIPCWQTANPGQPLAQTLRWSGNRAAPYHCDGLFIPRAWQHRLESCQVFAAPEWTALSDHNPVLAVVRKR